MDIEGMSIERLNHDCFKIKAQNKVIYLDPYQIDPQEPADLILVTHEHQDHCSLKDIEKLLKSGTTVVTIPECQSTLSRIAEKISNVVLIEPFQKKEVQGITIETIPAYNTNKFRSGNLVFHPKQDGRVGFIVVVNGKKIYHAGDTDVIPEMQQLKNIDIALLPVSGTYVMTPEEACQAVKIIKPKIAIPMHYGAGVVGTDADAEKFKDLAKQFCQVLVLSKV
ncbi:MAG TPA: MBL fold metallo-hydrolase [Candidatus Nanoarchaeia archaeon]|nr:MBL fold metallo-hydrolase [Candidatus Nanoarchaeia archaeon]